MLETLKQLWRPIVTPQVSPRANTLEAANGGDCDEQFRKPAETMRSEHVVEGGKRSDVTPRRSHRIETTPRRKVSATSAKADSSQSGMQKERRLAVIKGVQYLVRFKALQGRKKEKNGTSGKVGNKKTTLKSLRANVSTKKRKSNTSHLGKRNGVSTHSLFPNEGNKNHHDAGRSGNEGLATRATHPNSSTQSRTSRKSKNSLLKKTKVKQKKTKVKDSSIETENSETNGAKRNEVGSSSRKSAPSRKNHNELVAVDDSSSPPPITVTPPAVLIIQDVETRMMPKDPKMLSEQQWFEDAASKVIEKYREDVEKHRLALRSGTRTVEQALSEFKTIRTNERVITSSGNDGPKKRRRATADGDEGGEEPCKCTEKEACSDEHCLNRGIQIECNPKLCPVERKQPGACQNIRIQRGHKAHAEVRVMKDKGCGLFALERIPKGNFVYEYIGEIIDENECNRRLETVYVDEKHKYLMCMNGGLLIDATRRGNWARFINHSCEPNCFVQEWTVRGQPRMAIFALREIQPGEEITFNYNFQRFGEGHQECHCGARSCIGSLGKKVGDSASEDDEDSSNLAHKRKKIKMGYDPVIGDIVGMYMKDVAVRKADTLVRNVVDAGVNKTEAAKARAEGLFLVRNVLSAVKEVYGKGGKMAW